MADVGASDNPISGSPYEAGAHFTMALVDAPMTSTTFVNAPPAPVAPPAVSTVPQFITSAGAQRSWGSDVLVFPGLDPTLTLVDSGRVVAEALARRLSTPRGSMPFHPDYGLDLRAYLNEAMTDAKLYQLRAGVELECEQDERVLTADVKATFVQSTFSLRVQVNATLNTGNELRFVLNVSQVTVELLAQE